MNKVKHRWIDDAIIIDFKLTKIVMTIISKIEKYDEDNDDIMYMNKCDLLENITKDFVSNGYLTPKQRELLIQKYN